MENEVITVVCTDIGSNDSATYLLTQQQFPLLQQIDNFTDGTYGTMGQFGAIDLITLGAVIISMIGFNRVNHIVGVVFGVIMFGVLGWFGIIQWYTALTGGIATVMMLAIASQRKK